MNFAEARKDIAALLLGVDRSEYLAQPSRWEKRKWTQYQSTYTGKGKMGIETGKQLNKLLKHSNFMQNIPTPVTRNHVFEKVEDAGRDENKLVEAFVMTMVWGYGPWPVGPYRTSVMLESGGVSLGKQLQRVVEHLRDGDEEELKTAFDLLLELEQCGPAFATKFLYFTSPPEHRIPIFDNVVASWLRARKVNLSPGKRDHFFLYHKFCVDVATEIGEKDLGLLEYVMFWDQRGSEIKKDIEQLPTWQKHLLLKQVASNSQKI
jgi:hypothetical protein